MLFYERVNGTDIEMGAGSGEPIFNFEDLNLEGFFKVTESHFRF